MEGEQLISLVEMLIRKAVRSYIPPSSKAPNYPQAEYAAFIYFWLRCWQDRQPDVIREYEPLNKLILRWSQAGSAALTTSEIRNRSTGWDTDSWFLDRARIYQSIVTNEPQDGQPPSIFVACHLLMLLSDANRSLEEYPDFETSGEILEACLSERIFGDALEQHNLYTHAIDAMRTTLPEVADILTELHVRRLANNEEA